MAHKPQFDSLSLCSLTLLTYTITSVSVTDKLSVSSELLLRIDSMVLTGMIDIKEASELRRLVKDYRIEVADLFTQSLHKEDMELLAELRYLFHKRKK